MAVAFSQIFSAIGLGTVIAPQLETVILKTMKSPKYPYAVFTLMAIFQSIFHLVVTPETLVAARRLALESCMTLRDLNPLKFLRVFTEGSSDLQKMSVVYGFQMLAEGKNLQDTSWTWMVDVLKWDVPRRNAAVSAYGTTGILSGMLLAPTLIKRFGVQSFTSIANLFMLLSTISTSIRSDFAYWLSILLQFPGINGVSGSAISAVASDLASREGFGTGEFGGILANFRSIAGIVGPVLMGKYITWLKARGLEHKLNTSFLFYGVFSIIIPQLLHQTIDYERIKRIAAAAAKVTK